MMQGKVGEKPSDLGGVGLFITPHRALEEEKMRHCTVSYKGVLSRKLFDALYEEHTSRALRIIV